jgi:chemotaxis protein MotA
MNFSSLFGIALALSVFLGAAITSTKDYKVFLDFHAFLIVIGGTFAATMISFSIGNIFNMLKIFVRKILGNELSEYEFVIKEIVDLAKGYRDNPNYLVEKVKSIKTPFLAEAIQMLNDGGIDSKELDSILLKRATTHYARYEEEAEMFKTMAKFPPAFGLLGAVLGIIGMMQNLGSSEAMKTVGPSLAVALIATLYGIAIANFVFIPIGENLTRFNKQDNLTRLMILDGIKMIRSKKHPIVVEENIKSYLLPSERLKIKKVSSNA